MNENNGNIRNTFKYNMSFYYQSTIIYFVVFILYVIIRSEFIATTILISQDPILYFFVIIILISLAALIYNLYKNKHLEITDSEISFVDRFKKRSFSIDNIISIKITHLKRAKSRKERKAFRLIRIKLKNRKRPLIIRPYDYENEAELIKQFQELKDRVDKENI